MTDPLRDERTPGWPAHAAPQRPSYARQFAADTAERAIKTFAQALLAFFAADAVLDVVSADWGEALSVASGATVLSLLTSLASLRLGHSGTASATDAVMPAPADHDDTLRA